MCVIITENYIKFVCLICVGVGKINQHIYVDSNECCQYYNPAAESLIERRRIFLLWGSWSNDIMKHLGNHLSLTVTIYPITVHEGYAHDQIV